MKQDKASRLRAAAPDEPQGRERRLRAAADHRPREAAPGLPAITIAGRPNVGKSSLFNAILKRRQAIVHFDSGVTRDRIAASGVFAGRRFNLIDTGGLGLYAGEKHSAGIWDRAIEEQVLTAADAAAVILFVVDATAGPTPLDRGIAARLRTIGKPVIVAVNKVDNSAAEAGAAEFYALGFPRLHSVSCLHRRGLDALLRDALADLPENPAPGGDASAALRIAVLGRPNVGKSSIVNRILGEDRVIVSDLPGTTRDAIDSRFTLRCGGEDVPALLIDTAGLRKKSKVDGAVELYSIMRAEKALERCDLVLFVLDAGAAESTAQDRAISRLIIESGKGCVIVANKWDTVTGKTKSRRAELAESLPKMAYAPLVPLSAKTGYNFSALFEAVADLRTQMQIKIPTARVNKILADAQKKSLPPAPGGKPFRIYYGAMTGNRPPRFTLFVNDPKRCPENYRLYLENYFRKAFSFRGFPLRLFFRARQRRKLSEILDRKAKFQRAHAQAQRQTKRRAERSGADE